MTRTTQLFHLSHEIGLLLHSNVNFFVFCMFFDEHTEFSFFISFVTDFLFSFYACWPIISSEKKGSSSHTVERVSVSLAKKAKLMLTADSSWQSRRFEVCVCGSQVDSQSTEIQLCLFFTTQKSNHHILSDRRSSSHTFIILHAMPCSHWTAPAVKLEEIIYISKFRVCSSSLGGWCNRSHLFNLCSSFHSSHTLFFRSSLPLLILLLFRGAPDGGRGHSRKKTNHIKWMGRLQMKKREHKRKKGWNFVFFDSFQFSVLSVRFSFSLGIDRGGWWWWKKYI